MLVSDLSFFSGKRVFITGHTGFKGTWLTKIMLDSGATVGGMSLAGSRSRHFVDLSLGAQISDYEGDIRNPEMVGSALREFSPDIVFHLAAQALVRAAYIDPATTFDTNVMGSLNLLEAVRKCPNVRSLVYVTSDKCYENVEWAWGYREIDRLGGHDPYSASKAAAELLFASYMKSFFSTREGFGAASVRAGNVIGGGDFSADRIVPDCIRAIQEDRPIKLRSPRATRPWQHVLEPLSGYILLAQKLYEEPLEYLGAWNFGPSTSDTRTVGELVTLLIRCYGRGAVDAKIDDAEFHEAGLLQLNCDLARDRLKWTARWGVEETIKATADWYRLVEEGASVAEVTASQIKRYFGGRND